METKILTQKQKVAFISKLVDELNEEKKCNCSEKKDGDITEESFEFKNSIMLDDIEIIVSCEVEVSYWIEGHEENAIGKSQAICSLLLAMKRFKFDPDQKKQLTKEYEKFIENYFGN